MWAPPGQARTATSCPSCFSLTPLVHGWGRTAHRLGALGDTKSHNPCATSPRSSWALGSSFSTQAPKEIGELQGAQILLWILALAVVLLAGICRHEALRPGGEGSAAQHPPAASPFPCPRLPPRASQQQGEATPGCCTAGRALNIQKCLLLLDLLPFHQAQPLKLPAETRSGAPGDARREGGEAHHGTAFCCHSPALCATESPFGSV